ncbi:AMP-binding protein [Bradyrhizobium sp. sBnM-33]|uniref:AMP-binding protein n=1 Tax=Bradyrhizobium sp. sBnM-33 TaxID=2831780 RepID=UPI001BCB2C4B|nr:AMP-binding protein [Bradyrhizobium sp. sBnM-33]WOH53355.1 AMP-binding protein [Bradyrhizobium sp. sBnM-33]
MPVERQFQLRNLTDIERFETEKTFADRCSARSIYDLFVASAERLGDRIALTAISTGEDDETPREISYRDLLAGITAAANSFTGIGGPQPGVGILLPHLIETHFALWGAETAGFAVPINFLLQPENIAQLLRTSGARVLVALGPSPQSDIWEKAVAVSRLLPELKLIHVSPPNVEIDGAIAFPAALKSADSRKLGFGRARGRDQIAAYFHTGGTTGSPKLVAHTHRNQIVAAFGGAAMLGYTESDVLPHGLPMFHVAGTICCGLALFMAGGRLIVLSPSGYRNPLMVRNIWKILKRHGATISGGVPTVMSTLLDVPLDRDDLSKVRFAISGGAAAPRAVVEQYEKKTGVQVHELFGMTECGGLATIMPADADRVIGSVGFRLPYTRLSVRKLLSGGSLGDECRPNEIGVLTISGPTVTPGYCGNQDSGDLVRNGVLDSGDLAYMDEAGRVYIAGRAKDLIIRSGHNIDPLLIEETLQQHEAVSIAAAVGEPDKYAGELPVCYVMLKPGANATEDELRAFAEPRMGERPAWPKHYYIVPSIPITGVGKIFKPELRIDAVRRFVLRTLGQAIGDAGVEVSAALGGKRGMRVEVKLSGPSAAQTAAVRALLDGYSFEAIVESSA